MKDSKSDSFCMHEVMFFQDFCQFPVPVVRRECVLMTRPSREFESATIAPKPISSQPQTRSVHTKTVTFGMTQRQHARTQHTDASLRYTFPHIHGHEPTPPHILSCDPHPVSP